MQLLQPLKDLTMHINKAALLFCLSVLTTAAHAEEDDSWLLVARSADNVASYYAKKGSGSVIKLREGPSAYVATFKYVSTDSKDIEFGRYFVKTADCNKGEGRVWYGNMDANANGNYGDFVIGGGNINSAIAGTLCDAYTSSKPKKK